MTVEQLLEEMKNMFRRRVSRLTRKKEFEDRIWDQGKTFSEYLHNKVILGDKVPIIEYIIEGIPDQWLRYHTRIQKLESKASLLDALEKITLKRKANQSVVSKKLISSSTKADKSDDSTSTNKVARGIFRCYNCNGQGHVAKNYRQPKKYQPKKEEATYFNCGKAGHYARNCTVTRTSENTNEKE